MTANSPGGPRHTSGAIRHHFTVDVEEYFQVSAFEGVAPIERWPSFETRVEASLESILDLMSESGATGTFFVLGWLAERQPRLVRSIVERGHEVASHGWDHKRVTHQTPGHFRESIRRSKALLEDQSGAAVEGFRAPSFSIVPDREWALDLLIEEGYRYDSSLFPIRRPDGYGYAAAGRDPHVIERPAGRIVEVPPATLRRMGVNLPAAGGAYFRLLPYALVRSALRDCEARGVAGTFYIHPWEVDPGQPRMPVSRLTRIRHYGGLRRTVPRLTTLLRDFRFGPILPLARELGGHPASGSRTLPYLTGTALASEAR